ncbi:hypothetical protein ACN469_17720 [Corallococcus terminator]
MTRGTALSCTVDVAAPREVPIILGVFVALAAMMAHTLAVRLDQTSPRPSGPRVTVLAPNARSPALADFMVMGSTAAVGLMAVATQVRSRRARLLVLRAEEDSRMGHSQPRGLAPSERGLLAWRTGLVLVEWACYAALSFGFMLHRPPDEWPRFLVPCVLLLLPARVYVRYREGEAVWAPWLLGLSVVVLGMTREPPLTWGLLLIAGVCHVCVLRQEHARRVKQQREPLGNAGDTAPR